MANSVTCEHCGNSIPVKSSNQSLRFVTREADRNEPATFLVIDGDASSDKLLHRCAIPAPPDTNDGQASLGGTVGSPIRDGGAP